MLVAVAFLFVSPSCCRWLSPFEFTVAHVGVVRVDHLTPLVQFSARADVQSKRLCRGVVDNARRAAYVIADDAGVMLKVDEGCSPYSPFVPPL